MKKTLIILSAILLVSMGLSTWGACATGYLVRHNSSTGRVVSSEVNAQGFDVNTAANPLLAYFWQYSLGDTVNGGTCTGAANQLRLQGTAPTRFVFYNAGANWGNACANGCPGVPPTGTRTAVVMYQSVGEGTTAHKVIWSVYSVVYNTTVARFELGDISNGGNGGPNKGTLPNGTVTCIPEPTNVVTVGADVYDVTLTWTAPYGGGTNGNMGYYDTLPAGLPIIQDYEIYYQTVAAAASAPINGALAGWTLATVVPSNLNTVTLSNFNIPGMSTDASKCYFAMRPRFYYGSTWAIPLVGANANPIGPTASTNIFSSVSGSRTSASFTTNTESGVASFQAFYSATENGKYAPASKIIPAIGGSQTYTVKLSIPVDTAKYLKIKANLTNGTSQWSTATLLQ